MLVAHICSYNCVLHTSPTFYTYIRLFCSTSHTRLLNTNTPLYQVKNTSTQPHDIEGPYPGYGTMTPKIYPGTQRTGQVQKCGYGNSMRMGCILPKTHLATAFPDLKKGSLPLSSSPSTEQLLQLAQIIR